MSSRVNLPTLLPNMTASRNSPLFEAKAYHEPSVFHPGALLREARRQKDLEDRAVPDICLLDPDGDLVTHLVEKGSARKDSAWPGYHTDLYRFTQNGTEIGIIGNAVGAPFAVLVAEQLFAAGCKFLVSITSSGQIVQKDDPPYFVLIERALRDEGTSLQYQAPGRYAELDPALRDQVWTTAQEVTHPVYSGASWTTDAPFRETQSAITRAQREEILAVEMEAAALYSFAAVRNHPVVCFAHVTNQMGEASEDFEKGEAMGCVASLEVVDAAVTAWTN